MAITSSKKKEQNENSVKISQIDLLFYKSPLVEPLSKSLDKKLKQAGLSDDPKLYASRILFFLLFSIIVGIILIFFGLIFIREFEITRLSKYAVVGIMGLLFGIIIPVVTYLALISNVSQKVDSRRIGIEAETPAFSALFLVFLRSGLSPRLLFENLAKTRAFNHMNQVSKYIVKRINFLGESVETAINSSIKIVPSKLYDDLMTTYVTAIRTGAPVFETMQSKIKDILRNMELAASKAADNLSGVGEGYVTWLASGFISFFLILILEAVFPQLHVLPIGLLGAFAVLGIPLVNILFVWVVDQTQYKFPEKQLKADKMFLMLFPVGIVLGIIFMIILEPIIAKIMHETPIAPKFMLIGLFTLSGNLNYIPATVIGLTLGLIISVIPPYVIARRELKEGTGYDIYVARFLRAIGEGTRAGLSPETVIKNLKDSKELGKLQIILKRVYAYINLGIPIKDAFRKAADIIIDFSTKIAFTSLADMIEIGSLTPESVETLADQLDSQIRIRREYYAKIKILLYMPYVGSILALIATIILSSAIISLLSSSSFITSYGPLAAAQALVPRAVYIASLSSVFNAYTAGLLVGKLASGRIANGYLHSAILLVITMILVLITLSIKFSFVSPVAPSL
ncbi:type II secretion system F family protein [Sulfurisphaera javensis]|uniref:Type II secretion system F family protein n=1 Tax=Sulfurisphaera javensis TaxID=2049879 RepID=A0AAT9GRZ7_9CREN